MNCFAALVLMLKKNGRVDLVGLSVIGNYQANLRDLEGWGAEG
jgi:hypothetical protein